MSKNTNSEVLRQLIHISGVFLVPFTWIFGVFYVAMFSLLLVSFFLLLPVIIDKIQQKHIQAFGDGLYRIMTYVERGDVRPFTGAMWFFLSSAIILLLFGNPIASIAIMVMALGDGFSTLIGFHLGRYRIQGTKNKSIEGTLAGFIAAFVGCLVLTNIYVAFFASLVGALIEVLPIPLDDNFTVSFGVALFLKFFVF